MATSGSPKSEALIKSRINVIILMILAKMKREFTAKPRPSASSIPLKSIHVKFKRKIKFDWKSDHQLVRLSGVVDYSISYGVPNKHATNVVMVESKRPHLLKSGMLHCLGYMGTCSLIYIIRELLLT
jgi:hypothetical protein